MDTMIATRLGGEPVKRKAVHKVACQFWLQGICNRNPCRFLHAELPARIPYHTTFKPLVKEPTSKPLVKEQTRKPLVKEQTRKPLVKEQTTKPLVKEQTTKPLVKEQTTKPLVKEQTSSDSSSISKRPRSLFASPEEYVQKIVPKKSESCESECPIHLENSLALVPAVDESVKKPLKEACQDSFFFTGEDWFSRLALLKGHTEAVCGIGLLPLSDKLCSASIDGTMCIWDCHTGQLIRVIKLGDAIGCLIIEGPWVFIGLQNSVKACNFETAKEFKLGDEHGSFGLVTAMVAVPGLDILLSGTKDGSILAWKGNTENLKPFQLAASLKGHTATVTCLNANLATKRLYSSAMDCTIRVWDLSTLQCLQTLTEHRDMVMSLIRWNEFLLSSSLDKTIKVWAATEEGTMKVVSTKNLEHGAGAFCGIHDPNNKPVLLCSCFDDCVHQYELPSFNERGRIFSNKEVETIETGPNGLFFTGDGTGLVTVWKLAESCGVVPPQV